MVSQGSGYSVRFDKNLEVPCSLEFGGLGGSMGSLKIWGVRSLRCWRLDESGALCCPVLTAELHFVAFVATGHSDFGHRLIMSCHQAK